jgi:hypothetical protein
MIVMTNSSPNPCLVFQDRFDSLKEVVQVVYVDAGDNEYKIEVCKERHPNDPGADHFVINYFVKRNKLYIEDDTDLPWADGHTREGALAEALGFIEEKHPRGTRKVAAK